MRRSGRRYQTSGDKPHGPRATAAQPKRTGVSALRTGVGALRRAMLRPDPAAGAKEGKEPVPRLSRRPSWREGLGSLVSQVGDQLRGNANAGAPTAAQAASAAGNASSTRMLGGGQR